MPPTGSESKWRHEIAPRPGNRRGRSVSDTLRSMFHNCRPNMIGPLIVSETLAITFLADGLRGTPSTF